MFTRQAPRSHIGSGFTLLGRIYHATVRSLRRNDGNPVIGLLKNIQQTVLLVVVFYVMFDILGMRGMAIRGDFLLYVMSGIFLFMTHTKALGAVAGAENSTSAMMLHSPMNTAISIVSAALACLYIQILSMLVVLFVYHAWMGPITIDQPVGTFGMVLLAWGTGSAIGMVVLALKPWFPDTMAVVVTVYSRANMIASGKMFVANSLPYTMLVLFDWNPLFHVIDQARGYVFINYNPHNSTISYPVTVMVVLLMLGLMGEFYTRRHASVSWGRR